MALCRVLLSFRPELMRPQCDQHPPAGAKDSRGYTSVHTEIRVGAYGHAAIRRDAPAVMQLVLAISMKHKLQLHVDELPNPLELGLAREDGCAWVRVDALGYAWIRTGSQGYILVRLDTRGHAGCMWHRWWARTRAPPSTLNGMPSSGTCSMPVLSDTRSTREDVLSLITLNVVGIFMSKHRCFNCNKVVTCTPASCRLF